VSSAERSEKRRSNLTVSIHNQRLLRFARNDTSQHLYAFLGTFAELSSIDPHKGPSRQLVSRRENLHPSEPRRTTCAAEPHLWQKALIFQSELIE